MEPSVSRLQELESKIYLLKRQVGWEQAFKAVFEVSVEYRDNFPPGFITKLLAAHEKGVPPDAPTS